MEGEMENLSQKMAAITTLSDDINTTLAPKRERVKKLGDGHLLLKKLQFLFELPARLAQCVEMEAYGQAVSYYCKASGVLQQYRAMSSFKPIYDECLEIVAKLRQTLSGKIEAEDIKKDEMIETFGLLIRLTEDPTTLFDTLLNKAKVQWDEDRAEQETLLVESSTDTTEDVAGRDGAGESSVPPSPTVEGETGSQSAEQPAAEDGVEVPVDTPPDHPLVNYIVFGNSDLLCNLAEWIISFTDIFAPDQGQPQVSNNFIATHTADLGTCRMKTHRSVHHRRLGLKLAKPL